VKICAYQCNDLPPGKYNIKDTRLDEVDAITKAKKKTYVQVEVVGEESSVDADALLLPHSSKMDLILKDLEFVETRLSRQPIEAEKNVLSRFKDALEKETFLATVSLTEDEKKLLSGYGLLTMKPVVLFEQDECSDRNALLSKAMHEGGFGSFFTTGEKETRAWLIRNGTTAWEAAGAIHSDIQKGFIRAEIISLGDFISAGGESRAKQAGKLRLEQKTYIMQDGDITTFRFNK
jgi:hypothetical protein